MDDPGRQLRDYRRRCLAHFKRANNPAQPPGLQHCNQEIGLTTLWKGDRFEVFRIGLSERKQFAKGPTSSSRNFDQCSFMRVGPRDATPTVVEHCHLRTSPLGWIASSNNDRERETKAQARDPVAHPTCVL